MTDTQDSPAEADEAAAEAVPEPPREGRAAAIVLAVGALASLVGVLASLYSLTGMAEGLDETGVVLLALSLFSPIVITMFAGAVGGVLASRLAAPRRALAAAGSAVVGLAVGATAYGLFSVDASIALALGLILFGSALVGGLFALPRHRVPVVAGLLATVLLLVVMFARGLIESFSVTLFNDPLDQFGTLARTVPFAAGLACGMLAFLLLRRAKSGAKLPGHLIAGAIPGLFWLLSTVVAQIGVETLLAVGLDELAVADVANFALSFQSQYNGAMTALFAGALCSVLAYGFLLPRPAKRS
ncbi:hypothetical protein [Glycomyces tenuis]|uniref:hypothetical protein n=3 Tax=Glycomyces tenuis TaxID=58116 RepID=UPI0003F50381|nr:hypothetical protein [Glycomyces tenuis]